MNDIIFPDISNKVTKSKTIFDKNKTEELKVHILLESWVRKKHKEHWYEIYVMDKMTWTEEYQGRPYAKEILDFHARFITLCVKTQMFYEIHDATMIQEQKAKRLRISKYPYSEESRLFNKHIRFEL